MTKTGDGNLLINKLYNLTKVTLRFVKTNIYIGPRWKQTPAYWNSHSESWNTSEYYSQEFHFVSFLLVSALLEWCAGNPHTVPSSLTCVRPFCTRIPEIFQVLLLIYIQALKRVFLEFSLEPFRNRLLKFSSFK